MSPAVRVRGYDEQASPVSSRDRRRVAVSWNCMPTAGPRWRNAVAILAVLFCAGCESTGLIEAARVTPPAIEDGYVHTNEPAVLGRAHFQRANYALAERYFREAVEKNPGDLDSWIGLGASYDQLHRFELADRAYAQALRLGGPSVPLLNNQGYSYLLQGDLVRAGVSFREALTLDPSNAVVLNNIRLLYGAHKQLGAESLR